MERERAQRLIAVERMIQSQVNSARKAEPPQLGNPGTLVALMGVHIRS